MMYAHAPMRSGDGFLSNFVIEVNGFLISMTFERLPNDKKVEDRNDMVTSTRSSMMIFKKDESRTDYTEMCFGSNDIPVRMPYVLQAYAWCAEFEHKTSN